MIIRLIFSIAIILFATLFSSRLQYLSQRVLGISTLRNWSEMPTSTKSALFSSSSTAAATATATTLFDSTRPRTPVLFFSHGGPTFMYPKADFGGEPGAWAKTKAIGKFIKDEIKPKFIIIVSAHWQSSADNLIEISVPDTEKNLERRDPLENELIYDFYGFPSHMYKEQFHTKSDLSLAQDIKDTLKASNIDAKLSVRGIDHGLWVPGKVAFSTNKDPSSEWDVDVPVIQVSLSGSDDFDFHYRFGEALGKYRDLGGLLICSGMTVHNLGDIRKAMSSGLGAPLEYVEEFHQLLRPILEDSTGEERLRRLNSIKKNHEKLLYSAHPTLEHFMPVVVGAGAAYDEKGKELYNSATYSLGWGIYEFGNYEGLSNI